MPAIAPSRSGVTIRHVADRAGVSIGTVSRALKNQPGLTEDTRQQVLRAALELGYDTSNLRAAKLKRVSFLTSRLPDLAVNPFYSPVLHGVEDACRDEEIVLSYTSLRPGDRAAEIVRRHEADGLICAGFFESKLLERIAGLGLPVVLVDHYAPGFAAVNMDNFNGAYRAIQHLIAQGRRRIAFIGGPAHHSIVQRQRGFRQALFDAGIPADPALEVASDMQAMDSVPNITHHWLNLPQPPDAIFAFNDVSALRAMKYCLERGLRVPDDISIMGFDDIESASHSRPALSTVRVNKELLGRRGLELLMQRSGDAQVTVDVELVIRDSSPVNTTNGSRARRVS
jgi:LacI family transcriptional regulator, repressor for deo operon, udp, cdd, tsx, nupC, and nupG